MGSTLKLYEPKKIPRYNYDEDNLQRMVCNYLKLQYPSVMFRSDYAGTALEGRMQRAKHFLQSSKGWPDMFIAKPSRGYGGLFLELKKEGTRIYLKTGPRKGLLSTDIHIQEQAMQLQALNDAGYFARFGVGFNNCQRIIDWYLNENYKELEQEEIF